MPYACRVEGVELRMIRELLDYVRQENTLPDVVGERCVHALMQQASCRRCAAVCPRDAWHLDDESLGIDVDACDGCGLCAAVCPQGAILQRHAPAVLQGEGETLVLCICEAVGSEGALGLLPCVHALGLDDILRVRSGDSTRFLAATGDCDDCPRGEGPRLWHLIDQINRMLASRALAEIGMERVPSSSWSRVAAAVRKGGVARPRGPGMSRRGFFRGAVAAALDERQAMSDPTSGEKGAHVPPGTLLPDLPEDAPLPCVPTIDAQRCNGCDACARLCPHGAISLERTSGEERYRIRPRHCTDCGICVDVCDQGAVSVDQWARLQDTEVRLERARCVACGAGFHTPAGHGSDDRKCRICRAVNHYRNLYQVLS